jgi:hypothetical protein
MFGYPARFLRGNLMAGLHSSGLVLRLAEKDRAALLRHRGAVPFEPMPGRAMREYVVAPPDLAQHPAELAKWIHKSFGFVSSLPPKPTTKRKRR